MSGRNIFEAARRRTGPRRGRGARITRDPNPWYLILRWLTKTQMQYIYVQRPCRYCGAEVGAWCQTSRNEPAYDVHSVRHNEVAAMVRKLPIDVFPEWTKHWSTAEGCDPDAVMRVLSALRREGLIPGDPPEEPSLELEVTGWVQPEPGQSSADPSED